MPNKDSEGVQVMKQMDTANNNQHPSEIDHREEALKRAKDQQPCLATTFDDLLGDGGPAEESADEMIRAIKDWRETSSTRSLA